MTLLDGKPTVSSDVWEQPPSPAEPISNPGRVLLSTLLASVGAIHLVMVPSHAAAWLPEGLAFAAAGWLQIGLAVALFTRPSRALIRVSCLANVVFIGAWVVSRVFGSPFGPQAGVAAAATFIDVTAVLLEALLIVAGYELLVRPDMGESLSPLARRIASIVPVGVLILVTAAVSSPSALNHGHGGASESASAGGHHSDGGTTGAPVDDKGFSQIMNGKGEGGGHAQVSKDVALSAANQEKLDAQLASTKQFIEKYPTVKDAAAAGYYRQGPFAPGLGAHYMAAGAPNVSVGLTMDEKALANPTLIYDGIAPDSKLAGFMYLIFSLDTENSPEGFAGPNDHWHYHTNVCITARSDGGVDAPLGADPTATKELCDKYKGSLIANTGYMVHVWTVPGYKSPQGTFSNLNAKITCPNGTYHVVRPQQIGSRSNTCKDVPA